MKHDKSKMGTIIRIHLIIIFQHLLALFNKVLESSTCQKRTQFIVLFYFLKFSKIIHENYHPINGWV